MHDVIRNMQRSWFDVAIAVFLYLSIAFLIIGCSKDIVNVSETLREIRSHKFIEVKKGLQNIGGDESTIYQLEYYNELISSYGVYIDSMNKLSPPIHPNNDLQISLALYKLNNGLYSLLHEDGTENIIVDELNSAIEIATLEENEVLVCEIIKAILMHYDTLFRPESYRKSKFPFSDYLATYSDNLYDPLEEQIYGILKLNITLHFNNYVLNEKERSTLR